MVCDVVVADSVFVVSFPLNVCAIATDAKTLRLQVFAYQSPGRPSDQDLKTSGVALRFRICQRQVQRLRGLDLCRSQARGIVAAFALKRGGIESTASRVSEQTVLSSVERITGIQNGSVQQLRLRGPEADRPRADDDRRRSSCLQGAELRDRSG